MPQGSVLMPAKGTVCILIFLKGRASPLLLWMFGIHQWFHWYYPQFDYLAEKSNFVADTFSFLQFSYFFASIYPTIVTLSPQNTIYQVWASLAKFVSAIISILLRKQLPEEYWWLWHLCLNILIWQVAQLHIWTGPWPPSPSLQRQNTIPAQVFGANGHWDKEGCIPSKCPFLPNTTNGLLEVSAK